MSADRLRLRARSQSRGIVVRDLEPVIFLIGYRGSGKTNVARLLAQKLGWHWCDADAVLEEQAGKSIRAIFADEGEASFRDREAAVLAELCQRREYVIATGGGVILRDDNRRLLRTGLVVWLTAPAEVLFARLQADASTAERRPHLTTGGLDEVKTLLAQRTPLYAQTADITIDTAGLDLDAIVAAILGHADFPNVMRRGQC